MTVSRYYPDMGWSWNKLLKTMFIHMKETVHTRSTGDLWTGIIDQYDSWLICLKHYRMRAFVHMASPFIDAQFELLRKWSASMFKKILKKHQLPDDVLLEQHNNVPEIKDRRRWYKQIQMFIYSYMMKISAQLVLWW